MPVANRGRRSRRAVAPQGAPRRDRQPIASSTRRGRLLLGCSIVLSVAMLAAWFPFSSLLHQRAQLAGAEAQLSSLRAQDRTLTSQERTLTSSGDVTRLAREQYQLVQPGQRLVQVLPPSGTPTQGSAGQAPYPGDPGLTKPVEPSAIALLPLVTPTSDPRSSSHAASGARTAHQGLVQRILATLAFWRR